MTFETTGKIIDAIIFTEIIYSLRSNILITENRDVADHNNDFELTTTQQYSF